MSPYHHQTASNPHGRASSLPQWTTGGPGGAMDSQQAMAAAAAAAFNGTMMGATGQSSAAFVQGPGYGGAHPATPPTPVYPAVGSGGSAGGYPTTLNNPYGQC